MKPSSTRCSVCGRSANLTIGNDVVIRAGGSGQTAAAPGLDPTGTVYLPSELTSTFGVGKLVVSAGNITVESDVTGQAGGTISLTANNVDVEASVTVPGGTIALQASLPSSDTHGSVTALGIGTVTLGATASLNVAGLVVDDLPRSSGAHSLPLVVDGGTVLLIGFSLDLKPGSVIDASGGVAISGAGKISDGNGGKIALTTEPFVSPDLPDQLGSFVLGATLKAYGVGGASGGCSGVVGGCLSIQFPTAMQIGGTSSDPNTMVLSPDFFNQGGFASFNLTATGKVTVASNTVVEPSVQSYQPILTSGDRGVALVPITLPAVQQSPVSLALDARSVIGADGDIAVNGSVVVAAGASIVLNPTARGQGRVSIGSGALAAAAVLGSIIVPGGTISMTTEGAGGLITVDVAPGSVLSTAGTLVPTVNAYGNPAGKVLPGGSITLTGDILAEPGAVIDVSGSSGTIYQSSPNVAANPLSAAALRPVALHVDSDGGSLTLNAVGTLFSAATLLGNAGGPTALGGSLTVTGGVQVFQHLPGSVTYASGLAALFEPLNGLPSVPVSEQNGSINAIVAVDSFNNGRFDSLTLGGSVLFTGPVTITAARELAVGSGGITADGTVSLAAPHITLGQAFGPPPQSLTQVVFPVTTAMPSGSGNLTVSASDLLDIGTLALFDITTARLTGRNDIRGDGTLMMVGSLTLSAGQIYPVPASTTTTTVTTTKNSAGAITPPDTTTVTPNADGTTTTTVITTKNNSDGTTTTTTTTVVVDPRAATQQLFEYGGGNLTVTAGRNISGGIYYVEKGNGVLTAGGSITANPAQGLGNANDPNQWLPTTLFLGKGDFTLNAAGCILLGQVANAFMLPQGIMNGAWYRTYFSTYAMDDSVTVASLAGSVTIRGATTDLNGLPTGANLLSWLGAFDQNINYSYLEILDQPGSRGGSSFAPFIYLMPPTLQATAFSGDINVIGSLTLAPAPRGTVTLAAAGSIVGFQQTSASAGNASGGVGTGEIFQTATINLSDANPAAIPSVNTPQPISYPLKVSGDLAINNDTTNEQPLFPGFASSVTETGATLGPNAIPAIQNALHDAALLHANDPQPLQIYAVSGDITSLTVYAPKATEILAGRDILDIAFYLQNLSPLDASLVVAGRDIVAYDANSPLRQGAQQAENAARSTLNGTSGWLIAAVLPGDISIGGPGALDVFAGRNLNLGTAPANSGNEAQGLGLGIVSIGNARNPFLPSSEGAEIFAGAGITLLRPDVPGNGQNIAGFVSAFLDPATAGAEAARYLPDLGVLLGLGGASNQQVWEAFQQLPAGQRNSLALDIFYLVLRDAGRDHNDANAVNGTRNYEAGFRAIATYFPGPRQPGDILINEREIKTEHGGDINLLAPGGQVTMGSDTTITQPLDQGIATLETGNINIFANGNVTVGSSRIFTFRGGNEIIWSSTGNIAAGNASKTEISAPPARFQINPQTGASVLDPGGLATGGGIGTLQTIKGAPTGNVDLIAPVGFIDAGDAGIRVSGNLNLAAVAVLNAGNIQVQGASTGIPTVQGPPVGALTVANSTAGASQATVPTTTGSTNNNHASIIIVEVIGYGGGGEGYSPPTPEQDDHLKKRQDQRSYNTNSVLQLVGNGPLSDEQKRALTTDERKNLDDH